MRHEQIVADKALTALDMLHAALTRDHAGRVALVSSFGADSVVLLDMVAQIDRATPVLFGQTEMLFAETIAYQAEVAARLGLREVRHLRPDPVALAVADPVGALHTSDPDACCAIRKVAPLEAALAGFDAWISGRKRSQSATRAALQAVEADAAGRVKLNPLWDWSMDDVRGYIAQRDLPAHPLAARGYPSIGCAPCTTPVRPGEDPRAGRWRGRAKEECGIHVIDGRILRLPGDAALMDRV